MLHAAVVRSPHAHARLGAIRAKAALAVPGVVAMITAEDLGLIGRIPTRLGHRVGSSACLQFPLARDAVRYVGEPIAVVVAESRYIAEDALDLVEVDYAPLETVTDARRSMEPGAPRLHAAVEGNVVDRLETRRGDAPAALAGARYRVREQFAVQRHTGVPLETRGLTAAYDAGTGVLHLWGVAKVPHFNRRVLADLLGHPEHRIHFVELEVGGGFGVRGEFYPEDLVVPWAARPAGAVDRGPARAPHGHQPFPTAVPRYRDRVRRRLPDCRPRRPLRRRPRRVYPNPRRRRTRAHGGAPPRALPDRELRLRGALRPDQQDADRDVSRTRALRVHLRTRTAARHRRRPARGRRHRPPPPKFHRTLRDAVRGRRRVPQPADGLRLRRLSLGSRPGA